MALVTEQCVMRAALTRSTIYERFPDDQEFLYTLF